MSIDALASLSPQARARLISLDAHNMISASLWRAALASSPGGGEAGRIENFGGTASLAAGLHLAAMGVLPGPEQRVPSLQSFPYPAPVSPAAAAPARVSGGYAETDTPMRAIPHHAHSSSFESASRRSGVPAASLAAIIDAEAAETKDGNWDPHSRNPRSSAAGLGQFLKGTWGCARRKARQLAERNRESAWLAECRRSRSISGSFQKLLSLRFDAKRIHPVGGRSGPAEPGRPAKGWRSNWNGRRKCEQSGLHWPPSWAWRRHRLFGRWHFPRASEAPIGGADR